MAASVQSTSSRVCVCDRPAGYTFEVLERRNHGPRAWHGHRHRQRPGLARTDMSQTPAGGLPVRRTSVSAPAHLPSGSMRQTAGRHNAQIPVKPPPRRSWRLWVATEPYRRWRATVMLMARGASSAQSTQPGVPSSRQVRLVLLSALTTSARCSA